MRFIRLTVLRDAPAIEILNQHAPYGYNLFHDTLTDVYFLTNAEIDNFELDGFGSDYDPVLNIGSDYDTSYLKEFKAAHRDIMRGQLIHDDIVLDAIALSNLFSTRVLSVYSNDEACDFTAIAENGKLIRLHFEAGRDNGDEVTEETIRDIASKLSDSPISIEIKDSDPKSNDVRRYKAYEALQTETKPLKLYPYWEYYEGDIGRRGICETISLTDDKSATQTSAYNMPVMYRNALLGFEKAFEKTAPDFTDIPEKNRYKLVASKAPEKTSVFFTLLKGLVSAITAIPKSKNAMLVVAVILFITFAPLFHNDEKDNGPTKQQSSFKEYCTSLNGELIDTTPKKCRINNVVYHNWNLPGVKDERRVMILTIGPEKRPCPNDADRACLMADDNVIPFEINDFTFVEGKYQVIAVERRQNCRPRDDIDCSTTPQIFHYRQLLMFGKE